MTSTTTRERALEDARVWAENTPPRFGEGLVNVARALLEAEQRIAKQREEIERLKVPEVWHDGAPPKPFSGEWFIAVTVHGERFVLRELPEEYTYDFKTADETYIKRDRIKRWMQFPDSVFVAYSKEAESQSATLSQRVAELEGVLREVSDLIDGAVNALKDFDSAIEGLRALTTTSESAG